MKKTVGLKNRPVPKIMRWTWEREITKGNGVRIGVRVLTYLVRLCVGPLPIIAAIEDPTTNNFVRAVQPRFTFRGRMMLHKNYLLFHFKKIASVQQALRSLSANQNNCGDRLSEVAIFGV